MLLTLEQVSVDSFAAWRIAARHLWSRSIAPHDVQWQQGTPGEFVALEKSQSVVSVSRALLSMMQTAACYRTEDRWAFLYRVVWRYWQGDQTVLSAADIDGRRLHQMIKTVEREAHKMKAFLRFREREANDDSPQFFAWFEPAHDVLEIVAEHFSQRMGKRTWLVATPQGSARWNGHRLIYGPAVAHGPREVSDDGEALWLTYYRSTFNPARLNTGAMEQHMAVRYWKHLPEAKLIPDMISHASSGARQLSQACTVAERKGAIVQVKAEQAQPARLQETSLDTCRRCDLWCKATQVVAGQGPAQSRIMLVGEQPGDQEDLAGLPFVGPAGQLLDRALQQAGLTRNTIYVTNAVKHFKWEPRGKRRLHKTPAQREIDACMQWLEREIDEVQPDVIVALGSTALKSVLNSPKVTLTQLLGREISLAGRVILPAYHPAFILRAADAQSQRDAYDVLVHALEHARSLTMQ